jgi:hypothetical protein
MKRMVVPVLAAIVAAGCVSGTDPSSGAIRVLNAVIDSAPLDLRIDGELQLAGIDYAAATPFVADRAGEYQITLEEVQIPGATPVTETVYDQPVSLAVNDQVTLVVVGSAGAGTREIVEIRTRTEAPPAGTARFQFLHAVAGAAPLDVYVIEPDALVSASTPVVSGLAYKASTEPTLRDVGEARIVVTDAGNPAAVRFESGEIRFSLGSESLFALVESPGPDAGSRPVVVVNVTPSGAIGIADRNAQAAVRAVNAAPGAYSLDAFVNETSVDPDERQACDPSSTETDTLLELCALSFPAVTPYSLLAPGNYAIKLQKTAADAVAAQSLSAVLANLASTTLVIAGLTSDTATAAEQGLLNFVSGRRIAANARLRTVDASLAADAAVAGEPTTDRLEIYITAPGVPLADETPDFINLRLGSDTGYVSLAAGSYQLRLARRDTAAAAGTEPQVLYSRDLVLAAGGIYTLVLIDSVGGVQPLQSLSIEDDPTP